MVLLKYFINMFVKKNCNIEQTAAGADLRFYFYFITLIMLLIM